MSSAGLSNNHLSHQASGNKSIQPGQICKRIPPLLHPQLLTAFIQLRQLRNSILLKIHSQIEKLERWIAADADYVTQALGAQGAEQLQHDWSLLGQRLQRDGLQFFKAALDQLETVAAEPEHHPQQPKRN